MDGDLGQRLLPLMPLGEIVGTLQQSKHFLPGGPRDSDAARGVEQRTLLAQTPCGPADQVRGFLKSLMRARYAVEPLGHYGLGKKNYAHYTSPIRRYADLVVHRALFEQNHGSKHSLKETADHISDTERMVGDFPHRQIEATVG